MALDAGGTMHQVFAAVRIWQLGHVQEKRKLMHATGERIFGRERWLECYSAVNKSDDDREQLLALTFEVLHSSGWYDDPSDQVRTMSNMELSTIQYVDRRLPLMPMWPIYTRASDSFVGIEQTFDVMIDYNDGASLRYCGTIDGMCVRDRDQKVFMEENKTASRLDSAWRRSFEMSHQVTGYLAACTTILGIELRDAHIFGVKIKPSNRGEDFYDFLVSRDVSHIEQFGRWARYNYELYNRYESDWENAPRFTQSCTRYYRSCSMLDFCADTPEGRRAQWDDMIPTDLSPTERAVTEEF